MNVYLVIQNSYGLDWERKDNLDVFRTKEDAENFIKEEESKPLPNGVKGREYWIEDFILN